MATQPRSRTDVRTRKAKNYRRRGGALIYTTIALPVLFGGAMIAVDGGGLMYTRAKLQSTADAAALAAVRSLGNADPGKLTLDIHGNIDNTINVNVATQVVLDNKTDQFSPSLASDGVEVGFWDRSTRTYSQTPGGGDDEVLAVKVTVETEAPLYFAGIFGFEQSTLSTVAIATPRMDANDKHFYYALLAKSNIQADGTADFDSYDSDERRTFPGSNGSGDREFEGGTNGYIDLKSGVEIWGDFYSGPSSVGNIPSKMFKSGGKHGIIDYDIEFEDPEVPSNATSLGNVDIDSGTYTLPAGSYVASSFDIAKAAKFKTTGKVTLYLTGAAQIDGRVETHDMYPKNLRIVQTANADINITAPTNTSNEHEMLADIYNPYGKVELYGKVDFYGRIWGDEIALRKGSDFFADLAVTKDVELES
ncbi:MAG: TadG family pilus assembly protein, partial [Planctomycetota bacterium]